MVLPIAGAILRGTVARVATRRGVSKIPVGQLGAGQLVLTETPKLEVTVKDNITEVIKDLNDFQRKAIPRATVSALNRTITSVNRAGIKDIAKAMGTTQKTVRSRIKVIKANRTYLEAHLIPQGRPFRLAHFKPRQTAAGVTASAWGKRTLYRGTFLTSVQAGASLTEGVFVRKTSKRLPIKQLYGPGVIQTFKTPPILKVLEVTANERFPKEFESNLTYFISRLKR